MATLALSPTPKLTSVGTHVLHFGGAVHYSVDEGDPFDYDAAIDMTYNLTVTP